MYHTIFGLSTKITKSTNITYLQGFPTVIYFKGGNKTFEHPGLRKEADIVKFMKNPQEPPPPAPEETPWSEQVGFMNTFNK